MTNRELRIAVPPITDDHDSQAPMRLSRTYNDLGIEHVLIDLPSYDIEADGTNAQVS